MKWTLLLFILAAGACLVAPSFGGAARREGPADGALKVGNAAPDFELKRLDGQGTVKLSSFKDKKPVALVFGSYT